MHILIVLWQRRQTSRALLGIPQKVAHAVYSVNIESTTNWEPQNSTFVCFYFLFFPNNTNWSIIIFLELEICRPTGWLYSNLKYNFLDMSHAVKTSWKLYLIWMILKLLGQYILTFLGLLEMLLYLVSVMNNQIVE